MFLCIYTYKLRDLAIVRLVGNVTLRAESQLGTVKLGLHLCTYIQGGASQAILLANSSVYMTIWVYTCIYATEVPKT